MNDNPNLIAEHDYTHEDTNNSLNNKELRVEVKSNRLHSKLELPIDGLCEPIQAVINAISETYQCQRDFVVGAIFSSVSSIVRKRIRVFDGKYRNYMSLWCILVANSGSNKSQPTRYILKPLQLADTNNYHLFKSQLKEWSKEQQGDKPLFKQIIVVDSTPEARMKVLMSNPNGILLYRDEFRGFIDDLGRYNKSGELSQLLSMFDNEDVVINRKSDDPIMLTSPFMNILGGIQPDILGESFSNPQFMASGFNQRFLFFYPNITIVPKYIESCIPKEITDTWSSYVNSLLAYDYGEGVELFILGETKQIYIDYYNSLQEKKESADGYMCSVYGKLQIIVERWAGLVHVLNGDEGLHIRPAEMEYSVRCMQYFEGCAKKVYEIISNRNSVTRNKPLSKEQIIAYTFNSFDLENKAAFADAIGISRPAVSRAVNKYPLLRCYGYGNTLEPDNKEDT